MTELIVAGFHGTKRASEVLEQIMKRHSELRMHVEDAVAVYRTSGGKLRVDSSVQPTTREGVLAGSFIGLIIGGLLTLPLTAGASVAVAAGALGASAATGAAIGTHDAAMGKEKYGISEELVQKVGGMIQPGQSAVFVLADAENPATVAEGFRGYGATILTATLSAREGRRLQEIVGSPAR